LIAGEHFTPLSSYFTVVFDAGSKNGDTAYVEVQTTEDFAFNKYREFGLNIELEDGLEEHPQSILHADVHIMNDDCE
jgi:hypothetical protein